MLLSCFSSKSVVYLSVTRVRTFTISIQAKTFLPARLIGGCQNQRWSRGHKARGQGQGHKKIQGQGQPFRGQTLSRPRTGMLEAKAKDSLSEDRHSRGQGQECSRPRPRIEDTSANALQKKKFSQKFVRRSPKKQRFPKNFSSAAQNFNNSKNCAVLEPRTCQFLRT